ncbi:MAG: n-acetylglutamate synthase [Cyclobacteriaceae bacterium]
MINYHNKVFRSLSNSESGEVNEETRFYYQQSGRIVTATYEGGAILQGQLIAAVDETGTLDMRYQHVNNKGELMTGKCVSTPEVLDNGKLRLHDRWQWTSGDHSSGTSVVEEV